MKMQLGWIKGISIIVVVLIIFSSLFGLLSIILKLLTLSGGSSSVAIPHNSFCLLSSNTTYSTNGNAWSAGDCFIPCHHDSSDDDGEEDIDTMIGSSTHKQARCLPTFIIIGAMKCGTGQLMHKLSQHPRLHVGSGKEKVQQREIHYFTRHIAAVTPIGHYDLHQSRVLRYLEYFPTFPVHAVMRRRRSSSSPLVFEKSPDYIRSRSAITAIHSLLPGIKLVAILRDPVRRALSEVNHHCRHGRYIKIINNEVLGEHYEVNSIINTFYTRGLDLSTVPSSHYSVLVPTDCDAAMVEKYFTATVRGRDGGLMLLGVGVGVVVPEEVRNGFYDDQLSVLFERYSKHCIWMH